MPNGRFVDASIESRFVDVEEAPKGRFVDIEDIIGAAYTAEQPVVSEVAPEEETLKMRLPTEEISVEEQKVMPETVTPGLGTEEQWLPGITETGEISAGKRPTFYNAIKDIISKPFVRTPEEENARAQNIYNVSKETGLPIGEIDKNYKQFVTQLGLKQTPETMDLVGGLFIMPITAGIASHPLTTLIGLAGYETLSEIENAIVSLIKQEPYKFHAGKNIADLLPEEVNEQTKGVVEILDLIGKGMILSGVYRKSPQLVEKFTKDVFTKYSIPKTVRINPAKIRNMFTGQGEKATVYESDLIKSFGFNSKQYKSAVKKGIEIEVPVEKITKIVDKPYWANLKSLFGIKPYEKVTYQKEGVFGYKELPAGLLEEKTGIAQPPMTPAEKAISDAQQRLTRWEETEKAKKALPKAEIKPEEKPVIEPKPPEPIEKPTAVKPTAKEVKITAKPVTEKEVVKPEVIEKPEVPVDKIGVKKVEEKQAQDYTLKELMDIQKPSNPLSVEMVKQSHRQVIENFAKEGKLGEGIKDYPDLMEKYGQKPSTLPEPTPTTAEAEIVPVAEAVKAEKVLKKEVILTKIKKRGKTYDVVKKPNGALELRNKKGDVIPYSEEEYNKYITRVEAGRKAVRTKVAGKTVMKPEEFDDSPALSLLLGKGMQVRTTGGDTKVLGELRDLFDGILVGKTAVNAKPPMNINETINEDDTVEEFNQYMHDYGGWSESQYIERFDELIDIAQDELFNIYNKEPVLTEEDAYKAHNLDMSDKEYYIYKNATSEEQERIIAEKEESYIERLKDLEATEDERGRIEGIQRTAKEEIQTEAGEAEDTEEITEEELDRNLTEVIDFLDKQTAEKPTKKPLRKLKADLTEVLFDTADAKTGDPIKAGEMAWRIEDTGEFLTEKTYKALTEAPEQETLFAEEMIKKAEKPNYNLTQGQAIDRYLNEKRKSGKTIDESIAIRNAIKFHKQDVAEALKNVTYPYKNWNIEYPDLATRQYAKWAIEPPKPKPPAFEGTIKSEVETIDMMADLTEQKEMELKPPTNYSDIGGYAKLPAPEGYEETGRQNIPTPSAMELPEIVELARQLLGGKYPKIVKRLRGMAIGTFTPTGEGKIKIEAGTFKDLDEATKTVAHEIGHLIDWLPDKDLKRGNILGHIAALKNHLKHWIPNRPGGEGILTGKEKERLRELAWKLARTDSESWIDEEITKTMPITPEDILNIWKAIEPSIAETNPKLYDFVARMSRAEKKSIVKEALWGQVPANLQKYANSVKEKTGRQIKVVKQVSFSKHYQELIKKEMERRRLFKKDVLMRELENFTMKWKPFNANADRKYVSYRFSPVELYADALSALITNPAYLRNEAPHFYEAFFNYLENKPEVKATYEAMQTDIKSGSAQPKLVSRLREGFLKREQEYAESLKKQQHSILSKDAWGTAFIDKYYSIIRRVKLVGESNIPDNMNPRYKIEQMVYSGSEMEGYLADFEKTVLNPLKDADLTPEDLGEYLFHWRVATERAKMANPLGWTEERSKQRIAEMDEMFGTVLKETKDAFRKLREEWFIEKAKSADMYSDELIEKIENTTDYATFSIVGHLEKNYGREASSHIYTQYGTFSETGNPLTATVLKDLLLIKSINKNTAVMSIVDFFTEHYPEEIQDADTRWNGRYNEVIESGDPEMKLVVYLKNGKLTGKYLPKYAAESLRRNPVESILLTKILRYTAAPFKTIYTGIRPGFWMFNAIRDYKSASKNLPGMTLTKFLPYYIKGIKPAFKSAFGIDEPIVREMLKSNMLISVVNYMGERPEDSMIERQLKRYRIKPHEAKIKIITPFRKFYDYLNDIATGIERIPRIAGYRYLKELGLPPGKLGHMVRTRPGSPDFLRQSGTSPLTNNLLLYSNAAKEGWRSSIESFKESPYEYAWKTFKYSLLPKIAMTAISMGLLGWKLKSIQDRASEYDKSNYTIVPIGMTPNGKAVYVRIPQDETGRFFGGLLMKTLNQDRDTIWSNLFDYMSGQVPTLHPLFTILWATTDYLGGRNPYDHFRGRNVIDERVFSAGGKRSHEAFVKWMSNQAGGGILYKFNSNDIKEVKTELGKVLDYPIINDTIGRFIKVSDYGINEKLNNELNELKKIADNEILLAHEAVQKMMSGGKLSDEETLAFISKIKTIDDYILKAMARRYGNVYMNKLLSAQSIKEKEVIIRIMLSGEFIKRNLDVEGTNVPKTDTGVPQKGTREIPQPKRKVNAIENKPRTLEEISRTR